MLVLCTSIPKFKRTWGSVLRSLIGQGRRLPSIGALYFVIAYIQESNNVYYILEGFDKTDCFNSKHFKVSVEHASREIETILNMPSILMNSN